MKRTFAILVKNLPGVLKNVIDIFDSQGYNIDSLTVGVTDKPQVSRITIVAKVPDTEVILNFLAANPIVIKAKLLREGSFISRGHVLVKVKADNKVRGQVVQIADIFRAKVVDVSNDTATLEITGDENKISALTQMLEDFGILEMVRAGSVAVERGLLQL